MAAVMVKPEEDSWGVKTLSLHVVQTVFLSTSEVLLENPRTELKGCYGENIPPTNPYRILKNVFICVKTRQTFHGRKTLNSKHFVSVSVSPPLPHPHPHFLSLSLSSNYRRWCYSVYTQTVLEWKVNRNCLLKLRMQSFERLL